MRSTVALVIACSAPFISLLASAEEPPTPAAPAGSVTSPAASADDATAGAPATSASASSATPPPAAPAPATVAAPPAPATAVAPPVTPPASYASAPAPAPAALSAPPAGGDTGPDAARTKKNAPRPEKTLGIEADFGLSGRLGAADSAYDEAESAGPLVGGGLFFAPMKLFDLGLTYQRTQLGTEDAPPTNTLFANTLYRSLNSVWANVRTYPWRSESVGLFVGLMFGPTWESSHGTVTLPPATLASSAQSYRCSASGGASLALGVTAGADFDLGGGLSFLTRLTGASYHTPGDALTDSNGRTCGPGLGSTATLDARIGFAYRFDLGSPDETQAVARH